MKMAFTEMGWAQEVLQRKEADLVHVLRKRDGIEIEKSADQMDEIQYASERDLAIRASGLVLWEWSGQGTAFVIRFAGLRER